MAERYVVREYITNCIKNEAMHGLTDRARQIAAFQHSLCCKLGFGRPSNDEESSKWLLVSGKSAEHIEEAILWLQNDLLGVRPQAQIEGFQQAGLLRSWHENLSYSSLCGTLQQMLREVDDLAKVVGANHPILDSWRGFLVLGLLASGQANDAEKIVLKCPENLAQRRGVERDKRNFDSAAEKRTQHKRVQVEILCGKLNVRKPALSNNSSEFKKILDWVDELGINQRAIVLTLMHIFSYQGRWKDAEFLLVHARLHFLHLSSENHIYVRGLTAELANLYRKFKRYSEAEAISAYLLNLYKWNRDIGQVEDLNQQRCLAQAQTEIGKFAPAESLLMEIYSRSVRTHGPASHITRGIRESLINLYDHQTRLGEAVTLARLQLGIDKTVEFEDNEEDILDTTRTLANLYRKQGRLKDVEQSFLPKN